jgi:AmmeMemoRadiSam system protein B
MDRPKLRRLERVRICRDGEDLLVLRDPLALAEPIAIDAIYEPVVDALDGHRTVAQIRQSLLMRGLAVVELDDLEAFVEDLGDEGLLDDDRFRQRWAEAHASFVDAELREPRLAGLAYPDQPEALRAWLAPALPAAQTQPATHPAAHAEEPRPRWLDPPLAVVAPYQPPPRFAAAHRRLLACLPDPDRYDRVVILATDHSPGLLPYACSDKDLGTPLGSLPADLATLAQLEQRVGWVFREQLRLRTCDPLEWAGLSLRAAWGDRCPPVLAIACGQTRLTTQDGRDHAVELLEVLRELLAIDTGKVLLWTAAELSHRGPAYGHPSLPTPAEVEAADRAMLAPLLDNQPEALAHVLMERPAAERPSGAAALVTLAELLPPDYRAELLDYTLLPAPGLPELGWIGCPTVRIRAPRPV